MAQISEELIVIRISQLVADGCDVTSALSEEAKSTILEVAREVVGDGAIVELNTGE